MSTKFTPGPWKVEDFTPYCNRADALLIAHAPILFQMAEATLEMMDHGLADVSPEARKFADTLRAVIAQVKGEE